MNRMIPVMIPSSGLIFKSPVQFYEYLDIMTEKYGHQIEYEINTWCMGNSQKTEELYCKYWMIVIRKMYNEFIMYWKKQHLKAVSNIRKLAEDWVDQNIDETFWPQQSIKCNDYNQPVEIKRYVIDLRHKKEVSLYELSGCIWLDPELYHSLLDNDPFVIGTLRDLYWECIEQVIEHLYCSRVKKRIDEIRRRKICEDNFEEQNRIRELGYGNLKSLYESENMIEWIDNFFDLGGNCRKIKMSDVDNFDKILDSDKYIMISSGQPFVMNAEETLQEMEENDVNKFPNDYHLTIGCRDSVAVNFQNRMLHREFIRDIRLADGQIKYRQMLVKYILQNNCSAIIPIYIIFNSDESEIEELDEIGKRLLRKFHQKVFFIHHDGLDECVGEDGSASKLNISNGMIETADLLVHVILSDNKFDTVPKDISFYRPSEPRSEFYRNRRLNRYEDLW